MNPTYSKKVVEIGVTLTTGGSNSQAVLMATGIATNGVAIYGNADSQLRDAYVYEGQSFDTCGGHPQQQGAYHYHAEAKNGCVYEENTGYTTHSPLYGFMADGFPIYGPRGDNGTVPTDLDACGGHVDSTHPFYHYHVTNNYQYPYTINCLRGCVPQNTFNNMLRAVAAGKCDPDATKVYDYSSLTNPFETVSHSSTSLLSAVAMLLCIVILF